jgi:hypothetical protein
MTAPEPHTAHECFFSDDLAPRLDERKENVEGAPPECDRYAVGEQAAVGRRQAPPPEADIRLVPFCSGLNHTEVPTILADFRTFQILNPTRQKAEGQGEAAPGRPYQPCRRKGSDVISWEDQCRAWTIAPTP